MDCVCGRAERLFRSRCEAAALGSFYNLNKALNHSFSCRISKMSDVNELPDYDYDEDNREEAKNGAQDADGKKYVKLPFPSYINLSFF